MFFRMKILICSKPAVIDKFNLQADNWYMAEKEMIQRNIEEFARLQRYMKLSDKSSEAYAEMKDRYIELKVILTASGINLTELDKIKE